MDRARVIELLSGLDDLNGGLTALEMDAVAISADAMERLEVVDAELAAEKEALYPRMLEWRGVETPCKRCGGSGRMAYGNTATWRGGAGGSMVTADVCSGCWGSGDEHRKGVDLRKVSLEDTRALRVELAESRRKYTDLREILAAGKAENWAVRAGSDEGGFTDLPWIAAAERVLSDGQADIETLDGTDAAHPAWWRGYDHGVASICRTLAENLDGKEPAGMCGEPYESLRRRVADARRDGARLTYIIDQSNLGDGWLDDGEGEAAAKLCPINTKEAEDVQKWVRRTIDAAMQAQKGGEG